MEYSKHCKTRTFTSCVKVSFFCKKVLTLYRNNAIIIMGVDDDDIYNNAAWRVINAPLWVNPNDTPG